MMFNAPATVKDHKRHVALLTYGSRGDITHFLPLCKKLAGRGLRVTIISSDGYQELVPAGCDFYPHFSVPGIWPNDIDVFDGCEETLCNYRESCSPQVYFDLFNKHGEKHVLAQFRIIYERMDTLAQWIMRERVDLLLWNACSMHGLIAALQSKSAAIRDIPQVGLSCNLEYPYTRSISEYAPPTYSSSRFGFVNRFKWLHATLSTQWAMKPMFQRVFQRALENEGCSLKSIHINAFMSHTPILRLVSPTLFPKPRSFTRKMDIVCGGPLNGMDLETSYIPPPILESFLSGGRKPVLVSFGSTSICAHDIEDAMVSAALGMGERVILLRSLASQASTGAERSFSCASSGACAIHGSLLTTDFIPHNWLLPRVKVICYHGTATTTVTACYYGAATIIVPILPMFAYGDQSLFGAAVERHKIGVWLRKGPHSSSVYKPAPEMCVAAWRRALSAEVQTAANEFAIRVRAERNSEDVAIEALLHFL
jgi:sterol 3beta-glucosyltransferase